jgi:hypothetical protein
MAQLGDTGPIALGFSRPRFASRQPVPALKLPYRTHVGFGFGFGGLEQLKQSVFESSRNELYTITVHGRATIRAEDFPEQKLVKQGSRCIRDEQPIRLFLSASQRVDSRHLSPAFQMT